MHRPHVDELDPCPNCGDPVWRTHRCKAPARRLVGMPADFRERVAAGRGLLPEADPAGYPPDAVELPLDLDAYDRALREDVGL